jgi:hypothetical protein
MGRALCSASTKGESTLSRRRPRRHGLCCRRQHGGHSRPSVLERRFATARTPCGGNRSPFSIVQSVLQKHNLYVHTMPRTTVGIYAIPSSRSHAAFSGPAICFGDDDSGAAEIDFIPLSISNCLRHLATAESRRSRISSSLSRPSKVAASPISVNA